MRELWPEYQAISQHYSDRVATRSQVPLMNHINEGLDIMEAHEASEAAMRAYCLHPLFQSDDDLRESSRKPVDWIDPLVMLYTMEYRRAANAYLCRPHTDAWTIEDLKLYVGYIIPEVRIMLIADKVQNQKDFLIHHHGTHPRSDQLDRYFQNWLLFVRGY